MKILDLNEYQKKAKARFILKIAALSFLSILLIAGSVLLLVFSKLDYQFNLVGSILLSTLFVVGLFFYFFNIFPLDKHYYSLFKNASGASIEHRRRLEFLQEIDKKDIDKVTYRVLQFSYKEGEKEYIDNLYVLDSDVSFLKGNNYKIDTYRNIIVSFEEL